MFREHQPLIRARAKEDINAFFGVLTFCIATANARLIEAVRVTRDAKEWAKEGVLLDLKWGDFDSEARDYYGLGLHKLKLRAIQAAWEKRHAHFEAFQTMKPYQFWDYLVKNVDGLGMTKAAFAVQCLHGVMACLDTHNARKLRLDKSRLSYGSKKNRQYYLRAQRRLSPEKAWNEWCELYASKYPEWESPHDVSAAHLSTVN